LPGYQQRPETFPLENLSQSAYALERMEKKRL